MRLPLLLTALLVGCSAVPSKPSGLISREARVVLTTADVQFVHETCAILSGDRDSMACVAVHKAGLDRGCSIIAVAPTSSSDREAFYYIGSAVHKCLEYGNSPK